MTIAELRQALEPHGWHFDGAHLESPSGDHWLSEADLASPVQTYLSVARRRELVRRDGRRGVAE